MNTSMDNHPRVLSLSNNSSVAATPVSQSRRASHDSSERNSAMEDKTNKTLNQSIKKLWKDIKIHAIEHHRSVNAAANACYGAGTMKP